MTDNVYGGTAPSPETPVETPAKPARARVVLQTTGRARVLFEGLVKDAKAYVEQNFPRAHVEPPGSPVGGATPDVALVHENGSQEHYHADEGWSAGNGKSEGDS